MITAIVMASGFSRRFNGNKLLTPVKGKPLFTYAISAATASQVDSIIVVTQYKEILDYCKEHNIRGVYNPKAHLGQSQSVLLGVNATPEHSGFLFLTADQPNLSSDVIDQLLIFGKNHPDSLVIPTAQGQPRTPTLFPASLRQQLLNVSGDQGGRQVILNNPELVKYLPIQEASLLFDVDTREDLEKL